jgi:hypothetical protein
MGSEKTNQYMILPRLACVGGWSEERRNTGRKVNNIMNGCEEDLMSAKRRLHVFPNVKYVKHLNLNIIPKYLNKTTLVYFSFALVCQIV